MNTWVNGSFTITCDRAQMDLKVIAGFLASSYWAKGIPPATVEKSLEHSLCFALLDGHRQVTMCSCFRSTVGEASRNG
jgi:hypothetical protein